jgi:hypothetical protein
MTLRPLLLVSALGGGALAALPAGANPPCQTFAPPAYVGPSYAAPAYHAPTYRTEYVERVVEVPFAVPFAYYSFVGSVTTPPPVVVAAPPPPEPRPLPAPAQAPCPCPVPATAPPVAVGAVGHDQALEARLARLERLLVRVAEARAGAPPAAADDGPPPAAGDEAPAPREGPSPPGVKVTATDAAVYGLLRSRCGQCHTGASARGDVALFNDRGEWQPNTTPGEVYAAVRSGKMPRGSPAGLTQGEKDLLRAWAGAK